MLWFNQGMANQKTSPSIFARVALIGKFQAEGIDQVIEQLTTLVTKQGFYRRRHGSLYSIHKTTFH